MMVETYVTHSHYTFSLMIDETYVIPQIKIWQAIFRGFCYEHYADKNLQFNADVKTISILIKTEELHVPNECSVVVITPFSCSYKSQSSIAWPSWSEHTIEVV